MDVVGDSEFLWHLTEYLLPLPSDNQIVFFFIRFISFLWNLLVQLCIARDVPSKYMKTGAGASARVLEALLKFIPA